MAKKPIRREDFDEAAILNLIGGVDAPPRFVPKSSPAASPPETPPPETHPGREISTKEHAAETESASVLKPRKGSCRGAEYERMFLCVQNCLPDTSCRIKRSTREKLSMIVRIIGQDGMTVKSYVNNILDAHLEQYRDEINELINNAKNIKL